MENPCTTPKKKNVFDIDVLTLWRSSNSVLDCVVLERARASVKQTKFQQRTHTSITRKLKGTHNIVCV